MRKNNTAIIFGSLFFSCSVMAANGTLSPTVVPMVNGGQASIAISNTSPNLFTVPGDRIIAVNSLDGALTNNEQTASGGVVVAGLVMTVLTVGLVSCAGKSLPRFWPGDFFPVFYACHLAVLGVLAL
ncbi:hypothetical protein B4S73_004767 [Escherichia coli]|nr:hypothetical protein [Escherichia coli]